MNIHTSKQLKTAINRTGRSSLRRGLVLTALALVALALSPAAWAQSSGPESNVPSQCSPATFQGAYMGRSSGTLIGLPYTSVNRGVFDGNGNITGSGTSSLGGTITTFIYAATYTINSDCTGTLTSVPPGLSQNFILKSDGSQVFFINTAHPLGLVTLSGEAIRIGKRDE